MVAIAHFLYLSGDPKLQPWAALFDTSVAVKGFFILSGFLVLASYLRHPHLATYASKRAKRLLPAYIAVVLCSAVALSVAGTLPISDYFTHPRFFRYLAANLSFQNYLQPALPGVFTTNPEGNAVNGSLWTIKIEAAFYICIPLIVWIFHKLKSPAGIKLFLILMYIAGVAYNALIAHWTQSYPRVAPLGHQFPSMWQYFAVGMAAYLCTSSQTFRNRKLILLGFILFLEKFILHTTYLWPIGLGILIFSFAFRFKNAARFLKGNDYSYGIYLVHFPVAQFLISRGIFKLGLIWSFLIYALCVAILAVISWHFLEKQILRR